MLSKELVQGAVGLKDDEMGLQAHLALMGYPDADRSEQAEIEYFLGNIAVIRKDALHNPGLANRLRRTTTAKGVLDIVSLFSLGRQHGWVEGRISRNPD